MYATQKIATPTKWRSVNEIVLIYSKISFHIMFKWCTSQKESYSRDQAPSTCMHVLQYLKKNGRTKNTNKWIERERVDVKVLLCTIVCTSSTHNENNERDMVQQKSLIIRKLYAFIVIIGFLRTRFMLFQFNIYSRPAIATKHWKANDAYVFDVVNKGRIMQSDARQHFIFSSTIVIIQSLGQ